MVLTKTWNGTSYSIPQSGERGWASLTNFLSALADGAQSTGKQLIGRRTATASPVTVTATTDAYVGVNVSGAAATVNLPAGVNGQVFIIADESDAANTYNITINPNGVNTINSTTSLVLNQNSQAVILVFSGSDWVVIHNGSASAPISAVTDSSKIDFTLTAGNLTATIVSGSLVNADINASAAIAYSKLNLSASIVDADVAAAAAIARTKLASGTASHVLTNDGSGVMSSEAQLASTRGGTGVNNAGTLTYGANNITLTTSGATGVTLPTSGTLATLAGTEDLSNKTFTNNTVIKTGSEIRFNNASDTFYTGLKGGAAAASGTFILPVADGSASQAMVTDGSRQLGWATVATTVGVVAANDSNVTFTNSDNRTQICLPTAARTYTLPTTSIVAGDTWNFYNQSAFLITVNASGGTLEGYIYPYSATTFVCLSNTPTTNAHWNHFYQSASEWASYTPTYSAGFGTVSNAAGYYKCVGDTLYLRGSCTSGTTDGNAGTITIPSGFTISAAKSPISAGANDVGFLGAQSGVTSGQIAQLITQPGTSTTLLYLCSKLSSTDLYATPGVSSVVTATNVVHWNASVPIL